jgi:predicted ester cyclase
MKTNFRNKEIILRFFKELNDLKKSNKKELKNILSKYYHDTIHVHISKPFKEYIGIDSSIEEFFEPLLNAFPDIEVQPYIVMGGLSGENNCVCVAGNFIGSFLNDWLSIPANQQPTFIRFHATFFIEEDKITKAWFFLDILDVIRQAGFQLFPFKGLQQPAPIPMTGNGIITYPVDSKESEISYNLTNAMINGLLEYDGTSLASMGQERFWDEKNMMWYGPGGIGTTRGLKGFQENHQRPFLKAFPNRGVFEENGTTNFVNIAEGNYTCHFGYPIMNGTHSGDGWLGLKPSQKSFTIRVMDFWRREANKLKENWVMIDMIDLLEQFNVDVFQLLKTKNDEQNYRTKENSK